jgi:hypothetical protein
MCTTLVWSNMVLMVVADAKGLLGLSDPGELNRAVLIPRVTLACRLTL